MLSISQDEGAFVGPPVLLRNAVSTRLLVFDELWITLPFTSVASTNIVVVLLGNSLAMTETSSGMVYVSIWLHIAVTRLLKDVLFFQTWFVNGSISRMYTGSLSRSIWIVLNPSADSFLLGDALYKRDIRVLVLELFIVWSNGIKLVDAIQRVVNWILSMWLLIKQDSLL